ncbi:glycoside hydrolase family 18 protein [Laetiporus sulphureus 93-53]|uniref:Glycoside hydrolase family 18 protein n=1 Tax=Laetiporus sulphureus 93-53 TaxID=1314785 RepID=A0A165GWR8_9APHY|nr:glycoside hydrolase family 18 protein [Laetiporus sulphureus 93-53]KZT10932.1 glycoside hydrolase family 18 protein [Laetiporus sulphureus 93-53]
MLSFLSLGLLAVPAVRAAGLPFFARDASTNSTNSTVDMVAASWYAGWHSENFTLDDVSWEKYTHLIYSFAIPTSSVSNVSLSGSNPDLLPQFVSMAHENDVKAMVSIGGWDGSVHYSPSVGSEANITTFVETLSNFIDTYNLDGLDFDWEYPGSQGVGCNVVSDNDTSNFLSFLQALRSEVGPDFTLTASTPITPWTGANVSDFADVLDWINVMNYDVWGSWDSTVGPNSPLNDSCAATADQQGSAVSAVAKWTEAGMPAHQIVLGVASYGHSFYVESADAFTADSYAIASYPAFVSSEQPLGDAWDNTTNTDVCGDVSGPTGVFDFWGLIDAGFLFENGTVAAGIDYRYDECSQTPYVYNQCTQVMVSYDNAESFAAKGSYIASTNLRGFAMWEAGGDYNDILLNSIRKAVGFEDDDDGDC